jgi:hypothetical protein
VSRHQSNFGFTQAVFGLYVFLNKPIELIFTLMVLFIFVGSNFVHFVVVIIV